MSGTHGGAAGKRESETAVEVGGGGRNRTGVHGFAGRCMTTLPPRRGARGLFQLRIASRRLSWAAENQKGKTAAARFPPWAFWSGKGGSNSRPQPWQGCALPTELFPHKKRTGIIGPGVLLSR